jgi:hypothetical protein
MRPSTIRFSYSMDLQVLYAFDVWLIPALNLLEGSVIFGYRVVVFLIKSQK